MREIERGIDVGMKGQHPGTGFLHQRDDAGLRPVQTQIAEDRSEQHEVAEVATADD